MIKFSGETKNGSRSTQIPGYRCGCHKCRFHDEHPELVGRPLSPAEFLAVNPVVNGGHTPTDYGPEVADAWAAVEVAQMEFDAAERAWEETLRRQSRERLKRGQSAWSPMIMVANGNVIPNPTPAPTNTDADDAVEIAREAREEVGEKLRLARTRHSGLLRVWEQQQRDADAEQRKAEWDAKEQAEKTRKRSWLRGQLGK